MWLVDRKATETKDVIEWELASAFDFDGIKLPYRQVLKNSCAWRYRGPECGYSGGYYDEFDQPTNDINRTVAQSGLRPAKPDKVVMLF